MNQITPGSVADDVRAIGRIDAVPAILGVACRVTGLRFAAVARVTETSWTCCAVQDGIALGLEPGGELRIETTLCDEVRGAGEPIVIEHAAEDAVFCGHPTPKMYGFESYISMPIFRGDGTFFGTLCALDPVPAKLKDPHTEQMFRLFAQLIAFHLDAQDKLDRSEAALSDERRTAEFREQFIAVLGHDLRNPLAAVDAGAKLLAKARLDGRSASVVGLIQRSCTRMSGLISNLLDFARGRLGGGLGLDRVAETRLGEALDHVVSELRAAWPDRAIRVDLALDGPVFCDADRVAQLFSNLLANALAHGAADAPVVVRARNGGGGGAFELSVANGGAPIPAERMGRLFQPYARAADGGRQPGLGLGLFIASEIARAHGGTLDVSSTPEETRFTFRMPASRPA